MQDNDFVLDALPLARPEGRPLDPPDDLAALRAQRPLVRMRYPDGHLGWLATGHAQVRAVLADHRFSSRPELAHYPVPGLDGPMPPAPLGDLTGIDPPEHTRYRRLLTGWFTVRRTQALAGRVQRAAAEHLTAMAERGREADLVRDYAKPVPAAIICDVLGVPHADRAPFQEQVDLMASPDEQPEARFAAYARVQDHLADLAGSKRATPDDDLISALAGGGLRADEVAGLATFLLGAGVDTTASMIGLSALALLRDRERAEPGGRAQFHALLGGEDSVNAAVEELLRHLSIAHTGVRAATEDVELDGHLIRAGESVTLSLQAANRDPARFPAPESLDLHRGEPTAYHLAFGHGRHQCLGQQLARVELRVALPALFRRFPRLRLIAPDEELGLRPGHHNLHGLDRLPVAW